MKGLVDIVFIPVMIFVLILSIVVILEISHSISKNMENQIPIMANLQQGVEKGTIYLIYGIYFGIPLVGVILAYMFGSEPILLPIGLVFLFVGVFLFGLFKGILLEFIPNFSHVYQLFSGNLMLSKMVEYYPFIMFLFGVMMMVAQFVKGVREE